MKKVILFLSISLLTTWCASAQEKVLELKQLKQDVTLTLQDSILKVKTDNNTISFKVKKDNDKRVYEFVNPSADSNAFYELLYIDKTEINDKYNTAFPQTSAAQQLITAVSNYPQGLKLIRLEEGAIPADVSPSELGGISVDNKTSSSETPYWYYILTGMGGLVLGMLIMSMMRKKLQAAPVEEEVVDDDTIIETDSLDKLKAQVKKLREENKKMKSELKTISKNFEQQAAEMIKHEAFLNTYFKNVFSDYIKPFNEAIDKNDASQAFKYLFMMGAQLSSLTKHELRVKQTYDTYNISYVMKENLPNNNVEVITNSTAVDNIPQNIKTVMKMMDHVGVTSLGQSIVYGYKIQRDI